MALHIVSILDRSGSMAGTETEVIGAYNAFVFEQKELAKKNNIKAKKTLVLFDDQYEQVYLKTDINDVKGLDGSVYFTRGMTALYDAIGKTIAEFEGKKKVIFFIETDGAENASKEYTHEKLKSLVEKKTKDGWDFNFVGADLDAATTASWAGSIGIAQAKTMAFDKTARGYNLRNAAFVGATEAYINNE